MTELPWATPEAIGRLTLPQLHCLTSPKAPAAAGPLRTAEDFAAALARIHREEAEWASS